jgi:hypothetical protein
VLTRANNTSRVPISVYSDFNATDDGASTQIISEVNGIIHGVMDARSAVPLLNKGRERWQVTPARFFLCPPNAFLTSRIPVLNRWLIDPWVTCSPFILTDAFL